MTRRALAGLVASLTAMTPTPQANNFPSGGIGTVGATTTLTLNPGQAFDNNYTVHFYASVTINGSSNQYGTATGVIAIETNDGSGWVQRAAPQYSCGYPSGPPPYSARTCTSASEQVTLNVVGLGLNSSLRLRISSFSVSNNAGGSFAVYGGDGAGSNPGTFNGVNYSYDPTPPPTYTVAVTPDGGNQSAWVSSTGNVATFSVQNQGNQDGVVYNLSVVGCTAPLTNCTSDAPSVTVNHAGTVNATVHFDMQNTTGTGTITLRATHSASGATNDGTINVLAMTAAVQVGPDPGSQTVGAGNTGQVATFTVQNNGNQGTLTYALSLVTCGAPLTNCTSDLGSVNVGQGATVNATVHFDAPAVGTGAIVLRATHAASGATNDGTINVTVNPPSYAVEVGPDPGSKGAPIESVGNFVTFTVQNLGNQGTLTYQLSVVGCTASVINCTSDAPSIVVGQGATQNATVHFDTRFMTGPGSVVLRATHSASGTSNDGTINVTTTLAKANNFLPGNGIAAVDQTAEANLVPGNANGGLYTVHFSVSVTINAHSTQYGFASLIVAIESNDGSGWIERGTATYNCSYLSGPPPYSTYTCPTWTHEVVTIAAPGLGRDADIRLRAKTFSTSNGAGGSFLVQGGDGGVYSGVTYTVDAPPNYILSRVQSGVLNLDSRFLLQETANSYDPGGRIAQLTNARSNVTTLVYGGNSNAAFLTEMRRVKDGTGLIDLVTTIKYDSVGLVDTIIDEGGTIRSFAYDTLGRLRRIMNNAGQAVRAYGYLYSRTSTNGWMFQSLNPNAVVDSSFLQQTPMMQVVVSTGYLDGLGRPIQTVVQDGANYHVSVTQYDSLGRTWRVWKPYTRQSGGFDPNATSPTAGATVFYNNYHTPYTTVPDVETAYTADPLSRVKQVTPEHLVGAPSAVVLQTYGIDVGNRQQNILITDEAGKSTRNVTDLFGNVVRSILGATAAESTVTQFTYNVLGQRLQATDPRGLVTTYGVNTRGLPTSRTSPDAGTMQMSYDKAGNVRFTQDANQAIPGQVYFTNYDFAGRPLKSGLATATFGNLDPSVSQAFEADSLNCRIARAYDAKPGTAQTNFPWNHFGPQVTALTLANVAGRLAGVANKSNGAWQATLFSYDAEGRINKRYTYTEANGGGSILTVINTTVEDSMDLRGVITKRAQTVGTLSFYQWFEYDGRGLLFRTYANTSNSKPVIADRTDTYRPGGLPKDYQYQGSVLVPIRYTIREQIQQIGDPTGASYAFSAQYAYQADGVMDTAQFYNGGLPLAQRRYRYVFGLAAYDALNRMKSADFSLFSGGAWTVTPNYDLTAITYDPSGNLKTLQRRNDAGTLIDNLTYNYVTGTNRLASLTDAAGVTSEPWDAEGGSAFGYDANGNVISAPAPYSIDSARYDPANLPLSISTGAGTSTYRYDPAGMRITKQANGGNTDVYVRVGPIVLGVFTLNGNTLVSWSFNILWNDRVVGRQTSTVRTYYHFDHLGSVRVVVTSAGAITESSDYDPWGLAMPGRSLVAASPSRERFSGKEHDETGLDYFGGRYYMAAIGRWAAVDNSAGTMPGYSPYVYSFDSPLSAMDPDGNFPILITVRAFAPYNVFGLIFRGDGRDRRFSTYEGASSRISQFTTLETASWGLGNTEKGSLSRDITGSRRESWAKSDASLVSAGNRADLQTNLWGRNSLMNEFVIDPDIDVHTSLSIAVSRADPRTGNQILSITGTLSGDKFPATEAFVTDANGTSVFLGVAAEQMGPILGPFNLFGDKQAPTKVDVQIIVDRNGNFVAVTFQGATVSIKEWNAIYEAQRARIEDEERKKTCEERHDCQS